MEFCWLPTQCRDGGCLASFSAVDQMGSQSGGDGGGGERLRTSRYNSSIQNPGHEAFALGPGIMGKCAIHLS